MASLSEFRGFSALPTELRLKIVCICPSLLQSLKLRKLQGSLPLLVVFGSSANFKQPTDFCLQWEMVPQPERIIGQLPCSKCWKFIFARGIRTPTRNKCAQHENHPDWSLRWVGNSQHQAIFPPLQACRESRAIWLPRFFAPPRYLQLPQEDHKSVERGSECILSLRFDIPYVSYEADIFAVFDIGISYLGCDIDPLLGFDRKRIQRIGISENAWAMVDAIVAIEPQSLPSLRSLSILVSGPDPDVEGAGFSGWQEMHSVDVQNFDCEVRTISEQLVVEHPIFSRSESRLRHLVYEPEPEPRLRQLGTYKSLFKAWWWHAMHWEKSELRISSEAPWWDFCSYVLGEHNDNDTCPLDERKWCPGSHGKEEMLEWTSGFHNIDFKFLVERGCMSELQTSSVLEVVKSGDYEQFSRYKEKRVTNFRQRKESN